MAPVIFSTNLKLTKLNLYSRLFSMSEHKTETTVTFGWKIPKLSLSGISFVSATPYIASSEKEHLFCGRRKQHIVHLRTFNANQEVTPAINKNTLRSI